MTVPILEQKYKDNLTKLANYLLALPEGYEKFEMGFFMGKQNSQGTLGSHPYDICMVGNDPLKGCGTAACAVGHGPSAGIKVPEESSNWLEYSEDVFGLDPFLSAWDYCFGEAWSDYDNTPQGAGKRILYFLENGVPEEFEEHEWDAENLLDYLN